MRQRINIFARRPGMGPQGPDPLGCLFRLLGLASLVVLGLLGLAIGLGVVVIGAIVVGYYRARAWLRRKLGRGREKPDHAGDTYKAEVVDDDEDDNDGDIASGDRPRLTVEVRRRPHRD